MRETARERERERERESKCLEGWANERESRMRGTSLHSYIQYSGFRFDVKKQEKKRKRERRRKEEQKRTRQSGTD
jgi:hypothetical protein